MQVYLVLFSDNTDVLNVFRAKKRLQGYFFHGGYIQNPTPYQLIRDNGPIQVARGIQVRVQNRHLEIAGRNFLDVTGNTVKLHSGAGGQRNMVAMGVYTGDILDIAIYPAGIPLRNNPGQYVFPGGKAGDGEGAEIAALREFREETGVDLSGHRKFTWNTASYSVTYVRVSDVDLIRVVQDVNTTLSQPDYRDRVCKVPTDGKVMDDELESVEKITLDATIAEMEQDQERSWLAEAARYLQDNVGNMEL